MIQLNRLPVALIAVFCVACQMVDVPSTERPSPTPTPPPSTPTPIPVIQTVSHYLSPGSSRGEWRVIGLIENQGSSAATEIQLSVVLVNEAGEAIAEVSTGTLLSNLVPGEVGPYSVTFEVNEIPVAARVEVLDSAPMDGRRAELVTEFEEFFVTGRGELAALGFVTNPGAENVSLDSLSFLGRGPGGSGKLVAVMRFGPGYLAPGETAPFLAIAPENPGIVRWTPYHDGLIANMATAGLMEIIEEPVLHLTAQGAPFVVGTLANSGATATVGSVMVSLYEGNRLIGLWEIDTPHPLQPGEQLAFTAFGFPGISRHFDPRDPSAVQVETRVEARPGDQAAAAVSLPLDVSAFLSVGSAIFIRGTVHNPMETDVEAAVFAEVRSSLGDLVTAGWSEVETIEPEGTAEFVLDLPVPEGLDASLTEYDLRAIGLEAQP